MPRSQFSELNERLLRAGIAPRHVRRYVTELRDHFDDLVREETEKGSKQEIAEDVARTRIGSNDELAAVMLARPGMRSVTARFPWAVFGLGPVLMLALVVAMAILIEGGIVFWGPEIPRWSVDWARFSFDALNWAVTYSAPLGIAALVVLVGVRQRSRGAWIVAGAAIVCIVGAFHDVGIQWSDSPASPSTLNASFALAPPFPRHMLIAGMFRAAINMGLVGVGYWLWLRQTSERAAQ